MKHRILGIPTVIVGDSIVARGLIPADELLKLIKES
jgi:protein-disulfide isomerase